MTEATSDEGRSVNNATGGVVTTVRASKPARDQLKVVHRSAARDVTNTVRTVHVQLGVGSGVNFDRGHPKLATYLAGLR